MEEYLGLSSSRRMLEGCSIDASLLEDGNRSSASVCHCQGGGWCSLGVISPGGVR